MKKLSWEQIEKNINELADKIKASGFKPDYIIGIANGGLIPLYFLAKKLGINDVLIVSASSYDKDKRKDLKIKYIPETNLTDKKILLIDDIADTGLSLKGVVNAITHKYNVSELKTATLEVNKKRCKFYPDFYIAVEEGEWVVFPWEKSEFPEYFSKT